LGVELACTRYWQYRYQHCMLNGKTGGLWRESIDCPIADCEIQRGATQELSSAKHSIDECAIPESTNESLVSVCVLCGSPVWPSPPVVGPLWGPPVCVGPLCGSPVCVPCVGPLCGSPVPSRCVPCGIYSRDVSRSFTRSRVSC